MSVEQILKSDYIISFGAFLNQDAPEINEAIIKSIAQNDAQFIYMHPMDNMDLKVYYSQFVKYEVGSEEGIASMLLDSFANDTSDEVKAYLDDFDIGYVSAESSAGEEEFEEMLKKAEGKKSLTLLIGDDVFSHARMPQIMQQLSLLNKYSNLNVIALDEGMNMLLSSPLSETIEEVEELKSYNGTVVYKYLSDKEEQLVGSESFARVAKINNQDSVIVKAFGEESTREFVVDKTLQGTIALLSSTKQYFSGYRYEQVKLEKVEINE